MIDCANIMFDDSKSDIRSLPKAVRLQILIVLSFVWTTVFSLYVFSITTFIWGWAGLVMAHIGLIVAVYITFKFEYVLLVPIKGKEIKITFDDWIFKQDDRVAINRATMTKFGFKVAELTVMFVKD